MDQHFSSFVCTYSGGLTFAVSNVVIPLSYLTVWVSNGKRILIDCRPLRYAREFDVLECFFLGKDPTLPARIAVGHASEDDP